MPFDALPRRLTDIPEFRPQVVTQLPKPSIWPGIAEGAGKLSGVLAKALDPVEKAKEKLSLAQLSFQTKALQDYQSGKLDQSDFYIGPNGMPVRLTPVQKQQMKVREQNMRKQQIALNHAAAIDGANKGDPRYTHANEFEALLPQQSDMPQDAPELMPVEPDALPNTERTE